MKRWIAILSLVLTALVMVLVLVSCAPSLKTECETFWTYAKYEQWDKMWEMLHPYAQADFAGKDEFTQQMKDTYSYYNVKSFTVDKIEIIPQYGDLSDVAEIQITLLYSAPLGDAQDSFTMYSAKSNGRWMFLIGKSSATSSPSTSSPSTSSPTPTTETQKIIITYSATQASKLGEWNEAKSGYVFLILDLDITNQGYNSFNTNPFNFSLIINNVKYGGQPTFDLENELPLVDVLNGGELTGKLAFEVPSGTTAFSLEYEGYGNYNIQWVRE